MMGRVVVATAVGIFVAAGIGSYANAFSEPIGTMISLVRPGKLYKIVSKPLGGYPIPEIGPGDPTALGGSVTVSVNGGELTCTLAAQAYDGTEGWKGLGNPRRGRRAGST